MFVLVATALAGNVIGWPCQRLNWGWRNVWSTCSINNFAVGPVEANAAQAIPTFFRTAPATATTVLNSNGIFTPAANAIPGLLCTNAAATGTGATANLRNRCRRAIDAYGALVRQCSLPNNVAIRGPNSLSPDFLPSGGHAPHVNNVQGLTVNAQYCVLPTGTVGAVPNLNTPATTCPGLLGWFTVVFNACGFTHAPAFAPASSQTVAGAPLSSLYFPLGGVATPAVVGSTALTQGTVGQFCGTSGVSPTQWNPSGAVFRTSRCRKALDQFGRTAQRCHQSTLTGHGPQQAGGFADVLRLLAVGSTGNAPTGINSWAPVCN